VSNTEKKPRKRVSLWFKQGSEVVKKAKREARKRGNPWTAQAVIEDLIDKHL